MSFKDIRSRESKANAEADRAASEAILGAKSKADGWFSAALDKLAGIGAEAKEQVKTASSEKSSGPRIAPQMPVVDKGGVAGSVRNLGRIAEGRSRSAEDAIAKARDMVAEAASKAGLSGADILFLRADVSRWDDGNGKPQTGRLAFQIPFKSPYGDPRTVYANVDIVMGDLLPPRHFEDGLNKRYAFDGSGVKELLEGVRFDTISNPRGAPEQKFMPEVLSPDGIPGRVSSRGGIGIERRASGAPLVRTASKEHAPKRAAEGLVRSIADETIQAEAQQVALPPTSPEDLERISAEREKRKPSSGLHDAANPEKTTEYPQGDQAPGFSTLAKSAAAAAMKECVDCLLEADVRWLNFRDLVMILKQCGQEKEVDFDSAAEELGKSGIVLFRTAAASEGDPIGAVRRRLAWRSRRAAGEVSEGGRTQASFQMPTSLGAVEIREWQELEDKRKKMWQEILEREQENRERQLPAYANIDYAPVQEVERLMQAMIDTAKSRKDVEDVPPPVDMAQEEQAAFPKPPEAPGAGGPEPGTLMPEKGLGAVPASRVRGIRKVADAADMKDQGAAMGDTLSGLSDKGVSAPGDKGAGEGRSGWFSSDAELPRFAAKPPVWRTKKITDPCSCGHMRDQHRQEVEYGACTADCGCSQFNPSDLEVGDRFAGKRTASQPLDNPEACKNCRWLMVPSDYCTLTEFRKERLPFCGAPKAKGVGFEYAVFRECVAYDPIVKSIPQKLDAKAPESQQTEADTEKKKVPSYKKAAYQPKTGEPCPCRPGVQRDNCPACEGTGQKIDFKKVRGPSDKKAAANEWWCEWCGGKISDANRGEFPDICSACSKGNKEKCEECGIGIGVRPIKEMLLCQKCSPPEPDSPQKGPSYKKAAKEHYAGKVQDWISKKIEFLMKEEGLTQEQAAGKAYGMARQKFPGHVPEKKASKAMSFRCSDGDQVGCGAKLEIVKDLPSPAAQVNYFEAKCPECGQLWEVSHDMESGETSSEPILEKGAAAVSSPASDSVAGKDSPTGHGLAVRKWCKDRGCFEPAGKSHPAHDWCTLWDTAVENLIMLPSGAVLPKSTAFQSSESQGEGGPQQFGRSPNQGG